ncbi:hypothetical protein KY084_07175 [Stakelama sp. CBK3Z-3]|uniref:Cbb3-type cytochrome c oxidase subunit 3 n=1 Tax=Stakelama flava TaxID=2860338 RepID=A0ABS6XLH6_9SPHN|nr:hypothetical protein [Stakelama flava]MBW4330658.1 hypothetical protein [Stakelama flava]
MDLGSLWGVLTVVGPILLAAVIIWAILNNRGSAREKSHTEAATRRMYDEQDREDKANENR